MAETRMKEILSEMAEGLSGSWVIIVADSDGMLLSYWAAPENKLPPEMLGGFIQTINEAIDAFKQSTTGFGKLDDVIFSMGFSSIVVKPMADGSCFMVVNSPKNVPLGMIRMACKNYAPRLEAATRQRAVAPKRQHGNSRVLKLKTRNQAKAIQPYTLGLYSSVFYAILTK